MTSTPIGESANAIDVGVIETVRTRRSGGESLGKLSKEIGVPCVWSTWLAETNYIFSSALTRGGVAELLRTWSLSRKWTMSGERKSCTRPSLSV